MGAALVSKLRVHLISRGRVAVGDGDVPDAQLAAVRRAP